MSYPLYHTLDKNLKKSDLTATQKKDLLKKPSNIENDETRKAVLMLIVEHSKIVDDVRISPENFILPYNISQNKKDIYIDLENLPIPLRWIIWKFMNLSTN